MIKPIIIEKVFNNNEIIPNYWAILDHKNPEIIRTKKIIPISNDNYKFKSLMTSAINNASETIMLCSFILSDNEIIESLIAAAERNVRVYLLFSTETQLDKEFKEDKSEFDVEMVESHKAFLKKISGKALARSAIFHAKFLLVDYGLPSQVGFISTANFTSEALSRNQELGVRLQSKSDLDILFSFFQHGFWEEAEMEFHNDSWIGAKTFSLIPIETSDRIVSTSKNNKSLKKKILNLIKSTSGPLIVSSYSFKMDNELTKALIALAKEREITILTRPRFQNLEVLNSFLANGAEIYCYDYIHAKFILAPRENKGIIMTANFDDRGIETGYEVGIVLNPSEIEELKTISNSWIANAQYQFKEGKKIVEIEAKEIQYFEGNELKKFSVITEENIYEEKNPEDLREMSPLSNINSFNFQFNDEDKLIKKVNLKRKIIPPKLPAGARKLKDNPYPYDLFEFKGQNYLLLKNERALTSILKEAGHKKYHKIRFVTN